MERGVTPSSDFHFRGQQRTAERPATGLLHPDTLKSLFNLALCLKSETKMDEAREFARRAAEGAVKVLGANHPDTLEDQKLWQELQKK